MVHLIQEAKVVESGSSAGSTTSTKVGNSTGCDCNISLNLMLTWRLHPCYDHHAQGTIFGRLGDTRFHSIFRFHTHFQVTMQAEVILHSNTGFSYFKCWFMSHMSHSVAFCNLSGTEGHLVATHFHPSITRLWIANERPIFLQVGSMFLTWTRLVRFHEIEIELDSQVETSEVVPLVFWGALSMFSLPGKLL